MPAIAASVLMPGAGVWPLAFLAPLFEQVFDPDPIEHEEACYESARDEDLEERLAGEGLHPLKGAGAIFARKLGGHGHQAEEHAQCHISQQADNEENLEKFPKAPGAQGNGAFPAGGTVGRLVGLRQLEHKGSQGISWLRFFILPSIQEKNICGKSFAIVKSAYTNEAFS